MDKIIGNFLYIYQKDLPVKADNSIKQKDFSIIKGKNWLCFYKGLTLKKIDKEKFVLYQDELDNFSYDLDIFKRTNDFLTIFKKISEYFSGAFTFCYIDNEVCHIVRDRFGCYPIYFYQNKDIFIVSSSISLILDSGYYYKEVDLITVNYFLTMGYIPCPKTMFKGIFQVKPGHILSYNYKNKQISEVPYYQFQFKYEKEARKPEEYYFNQLFYLLKKAVKQRLKGDKKIGAFLSGGLDTSSIVGIMSKINAPVKVFSIGFKESDFNEIPYAQIVAKYLGCDHYTYIVEPKDLPSLIKKMIKHINSPFMDTSFIPSYYAAKLAKEHVDIVLTGDGADQLLGSSYHLIWLERKPTPSWMYLPLRKIFNTFPISCVTESYIDKFKRWLYVHCISWEERIVLSYSFLKEFLKKEIFTNNFFELNKSYPIFDFFKPIFERAQGHGPLNKVLMFDINYFLPDDLLVKVYGTCFAHDLKTRMPFLDKDLVYFMATIPESLKIKNGIIKYPLKQSVKDLLPPQILKRRKQGFGIPEDLWIRIILKPYIREILLDQRTLQRGYFKPKAFEALLTRYFSGKTSYATGSNSLIFGFLTLELWHRIFIDD